VIFGGIDFQIELPVKLSLRSDVRGAERADCFARTGDLVDSAA